MKCPKCGTPNQNGSKFCKGCGAELNAPIPEQNFFKKHKNEVIIGGLIVVIILLLTCVLVFGGFFKTPLEEQDFGVLTMLAPKGSVFEESSSLQATPYSGGFIYLTNEGAYRKQVGVLGITTILVDTPPEEFKFDRTEGDITIYKDASGQSNAYHASKKVGGYQVILMGEDLNAMIEMLNSIEITNAPTTQTSQTSTSTPTTQTTTSSINILGGSFSTGSAEEDKTYARINVGQSHAGESYIVQIYYSRDGSSLNNGNMVPVSVHSDGYIEVASAEAYHFYPDNAVINIYDTNNNLLTTKTVNLSPTSGTQTF